MVKIVADSLEFRDVYIAFAHCIHEYDLYYYRCMYYPILYYFYREYVLWWLTSV